MFLFFGDQLKTQDDDCREPVGMAVTHVDDVLYAGEENFEREIIERIKEVFKFGAEEELEFRYVGMNFDQYAQGDFGGS